MNAVLEVVDAIVRHAGAIVIGVTCVLAVGCVSMVLCRRPAERRRLGLLTAMSCGLYLALACVPLPRWESTDAVAIERTPAAITPAPITPATMPSVNDLPAVEQRLAALLKATESLAASDPEASLAAAAASSVGASTATLPLPMRSVTTWTWSRLAVLAWMVLAAAMLLRALVGAMRLWFVLRTSRPVPASMLDAMSLPRSLRLRVAARSLRPFCAYWFGPVVVVPQSLLLPERRSQAIAVTQHELAHVRAGDPQLQLLLATLSLPLAAHPLFWWLTRDLRFHAELLADDAAAAATGATRYARDLIDLAERAEPELAAIGAVPVFHRPSEFFRRIQMLLQREGRLSTSSSLARRFVHTTAAFVAVSLAAATFGVPAAAQDPAPKRDRATQTAELRAQIDSLRAELDAVRMALKQAQAAAQPHGEAQGHPGDSAKGEWRPEAVPTPDAASGGDATPAPSDVAGRWLRAAAESPPDLRDKEQFLAGSVPVHGHEVHTPGAWSDARVRELLHAEGFGHPAAAPTDIHRQVTRQWVATIDELLRDKRIRSGASWAEVREFLDEKRPVDVPGEPAPAGVHPHPTDPTSHSPVDARGADGSGHGVSHGQGHGQGHGDSAASVVGTASTLPASDTFPAPTPAPAPRQEPEVVASMTIAATAEIVSRCLDLKGELEVAEMEAEDQQVKHEAGVVSSIETKRSAMKVATLQRKYTMVQRLIDGEVEATKREIKRFEWFVACGNADEKACAEAQIARAKARLDALHAAR